MKTCTKCGNEYMTDRCRPCANAEWRIYRSKNLEKCKASARKASSKYRKLNPEKAKIWKEKNKNRMRELQYAWRDKNREHVNALSRKRYADNREKYISVAKQWQENHKEQVKASQARYRANNPEKVKAKNARRDPEILRLHCANRRAKRKAAGGKLSKGIAETLFKLQKGKCACCRNDLNRYHLDHVMPLALGGTNTDENIQLLCPACNQAKHAKHPVDFMQSRGFLL